MLRNKKLRLSFQEFIRKFPYEIWLTITFDDPVSTSIAKRKLKKFLKHLNKAEDVFYHKYVRLWVFFEKENVRNGVHIHALLSGMDTSKCSQLERKCFKRFGESKVTVGHENVIPYVAEKYNSPSLDDFDYIKVNSHFRKFK